MVLNSKNTFGLAKKGEGPAGNAGPLSNKFKWQTIDEGFERIADVEGVNKMDTEKKYRSLIDKLVEKGAVHMKGQVLIVPIDEIRAKNLINAGYIEEVKEGEDKKAEEKVADVPENKMETGDNTKKKDITGKGANLLKNKKK